MHTRRLTVDVDDVARLRSFFKDQAFDPVQFAVLCEYAGAHGIMASLLPGGGGLQQRDVELIKQVHQSFFNLHLPLDNEHCKLALSLKPDMVTFVQTSKAHPAPAPLEPEFILTALPEVLPNFQANNIAVAVYISPSIATLKELTKVHIDYVEFDCNGLALAADTNEELVALDTLRSAVFAAAKLGLGVNVFGAIEYEHLPALAAIGQLEDVTMGRSLLRRALQVGIDRAVQEALRGLNAAR